MKVTDSLFMRVAPWAVVVLLLAIFGVDLLTPLGVAGWLLYALPLALSSLSSRGRDPLYVAAAVMVLVAIGFVASPEGLEPHLAAMNRAIGVGLLWAFAITIVSWRRGRLHETNLTAALSEEQVERAHAEGLMLAAQEARAYADTALVGAAAGRQAAESSLVVSQLRMEGLIQSAMDAIITVDQKQKVVLFNRAAEKMFQCSADEALGQPLDRFIPTRFRGAHQGYVDEFGKSGSTSRRMGALGQVSGLRASGEEFPMEAAISQVHVDGAKFFTVILRDITERLRVQEALRESERAHRTLLANLSGMAYRCRNDKDWTMEFVSEGCQTLTGYPPDDLLHNRRLSFNALIHPDDQEQVWHDCQRSLGRREPCSNEYRIRTASGEEKWVWAQAQGVYSDAGDLVAIEGFITDITERKQAQEQLRRTERLAELGTLASGMAHEIGTPMNVIMGRAEHLMQRTTDEKAKKGLQIIVTQVERITKIMNQLLSMARRRIGERKPADLRRIIEDCLEVLQERLKRHKVQVVKDYAHQTHPAVVDSDQMSQVLLNLFLNADHAMTEGGTLRIGLRAVKGQVILTVSDTGHGIPEDILPKIFTPFFTTKEAGKGTGLGLSVVHGIIEEHQGTIAVESEVGKGTTFTITLPGARTSGAISS